MDDIASKIFEAEIPFNKDSTDEEEKCNKMIESLSEKQLENAARTSYAYLKVSTQSTLQPDSHDKIRKRMALRMARRHLVAEKGDETLALNKMIATLEFRSEMQVDDVRQEYCDDKDIVNNPGNKGFVVCGYDVDHRALLLRFPKYVATMMSEDQFIKLAMYNLERAIACTERKSLGKHEKIVVGANSKQTGGLPPMSLLKKIVSMFQNHYPERLHINILVEPPFFARTFMKLVLSFLDPDTRAKILVISNNNEKESKLKSIIDEDQAMPFLRVNGKIEESLDTDRYFRNLPFDCAANE